MVWIYTWSLKLNLSILAICYLKPKWPIATAKAISKFGGSYRPLWLNASAYSLPFGRSDSRFRESLHIEILTNTGLYSDLDGTQVCESPPGDRNWHFPHGSSYVKCLDTKLNQSQNHMPFSFGNASHRLSCPPHTLSISVHKLLAFWMDNIGIPSFLWH